MRRCIGVLMEGVLKHLEDTLEGDLEGDLKGVLKHLEDTLEGVLEGVLKDPHGGGPQASPHDPRSMTLLMSP